MRRKLGYTAGIVFVLLALLTPLVVSAQGELTLESLAEQFAGLVSRVVKLEEYLATPELELTDDGCILIQYHEDDVAYPSSNVPLIQDKTFLSYRQKFNRNLDRLHIIRVDRFNNGAVAIYYLESSEDLVVAEVFDGCEFLDHTGWNASD